MLNKRAMFGLTLMLSGGLILVALPTQNDINHKQVEVGTETLLNDKTADQTSPQVMTVDVETEERLLKEKRKQRQEIVLEQERQSAALLAEQEKARQQALQKQAEDQPVVPTVQTRPEAIALAQAQKKQQEQQAQMVHKIEEKEDAHEMDVANDAASTQLSAKEKRKIEEAKRRQVRQSGRYTVQAGDTFARLAKEYGISVSALAQANNMGHEEYLPEGTVIKIPIGK